MIADSYTGRQHTRSKRNVPRERFLHGASLLDARLESLLGLRTRLLERRSNVGFRKCIRCPLQRRDGNNGRCEYERGIERSGTKYSAWHAFSCSLHFSLLHIAVDIHRCDEQSFFAAKQFYIHDADERLATVRGCWHSHRNIQRWTQQSYWIQSRTRGARQRQCFRYENYLFRHLQSTQKCNFHRISTLVHTNNPFQMCTKYF